MNRIIIYATALVVLASGCKKTFNDTVQGKSADERLYAALAAYQQKLSGAPYGWIMLETTTGTAFNQGVSQSGPAATFSYYMQFNDSNKVTMYSDFDTSMAGTPKISSFRIKALQRPSLIFDTYSYLHIPCDPNPAISKSPFGTGFGWGADFEYSFADSVPASGLGDTIRLKGNLNLAGAVLVKATKAQQDAWLNGGGKKFAGGIANLNNIFNYFKRLTIGGVSYEIRFDATTRTATLTWLDGSGNLQTATSSYYSTSTGIVFTTPFKAGNTTIKSIDDVAWDGTNNILAVVVNGSSGSIAGFTVPLKIDGDAPVRWYNYAIANGYYWASLQGFHSMGVDDAFGVTKLVSGTARFYQYAYWPQYYTNPADMFSPLLLNGNSLSFNSYRTVPNSPPTLTADGRLIFSRLINQGTIPPGGAVDKSNIAIYDPAGFYFIQTGPKSYDMVIASDAKTWITWVWPL